MIIRPDQARVYSQGLGEARIMVGGESTGGAWWMGQFREDPGFTTTLHLHPKGDEQVYILDGVLSVFLDGKWHDLEPGCVGVLPHGVPHAQANHGTRPVHFVGSGTPAGFERFFPELNELVLRIPPGDPRFPVEVTKLIAQHDTQVLGPPPPRS